MYQRLGTTLMLLIFYLSWEHYESFEHVDHCPETMCKCYPKAMLVNCTGSAVYYVPVFPAYTRTVIFTKTNFPKITGKFLFNLTLVQVERLHFIDTLTNMIDPDAFTNLTNMFTLEISRNGDIRQNVISNILQYSPRIQILSLKSNLWKTIRKDIFSEVHNSSIQTLSFSDNLIENIYGSYFSSLHFLRNLDLSNNLISNFNCTGFESTSISDINLENNAMRELPSFCGPTGQSTVKIKTLVFRQNYLHNLNEYSFQCLPFLRNLYLDKTSLVTLRNNTFTRLPKLEKLSMTSNGDHLRTIEGFAFNSSSLKKLYFGQNRYRFEKVSWLYGKLFHSLPNLLLLDLTGNFLPSDSQSLRELFTPLVKLEKLILQNTALKALPRNVFQQMPNLRSLILIGNYISGWNNDPEVFGNVTSLRSLYLDGNNIKVINKTPFQESFLNVLDEFCITDNPFSCTCDLMWFLDWMKSTKHTKIVNYPRRYTCRFPPEMNNVLLKNYNPTVETCSRLNFPLIRNICIAVFVPSAIILIAISLAYKFRFRLNYWLHILGIKRVGYKRIKDDRDYEYDAFVIYSNDNRDFIFDHMIPELEEKAGCRLCVHERDFEVGRFILDNITRKFEVSKNIILVLSRDFLNSEWCKFELVLTQSKTALEGPGVLTVILLEELDTAVLPSSVRAILDTVTYTEWSQENVRQSRIWAKVITALNTNGLSGEAH
ncbi:toll-like receptor 13 [Ylistrum balloti]|uniref:toll-like receptor 13 n=1 Tax=Ylistrum balloti TaxID=509963 RepID=UPI002905DF7F|nr:toll-like receptor 13 [Ylistrum balloti]